MANPFAVTSPFFTTETSFAVTTDDTSYKPLERTGYTPGTRSGQRLSVYYPTQAAGNYPVNSEHPNTYSYVLWPQKNGTASPTTLVGGAAQNPAADAITTALSGSAAGVVLSGLAIQLLNNGVAIVPVRVTCPGDNTTDTFGTNPTGNGFLHAPGGTENYYEGLASPNASSDIVLAAQYVQWRAEALGLCKRSWCIMGNSSGANVSAWLACAPNRAFELGSYGQYQESTVPNCFLGLNFLSTWWRYANLSTANGSTNFPQVESGTGFNIVAGTPTAAPQRYLREFSIAHYLSDIGGDCIPYTWLWSDIASTSNNLSLPFTENAQVSAHEAITLLRLKYLVNPLRVFVAVGDGGVVCNTSQSFSQFVDRVDMTGADPADPDVPGAVDEEGNEAVFDPADMDGTKAAAFVLKHINDKPWDSEIPSAGIGRRGQVNSIGRFVVPANPKRAGVVIKPSGRSLMGHVDLLWGDSPYGATNVLRPGDKPVVVPGQGPIWCQAAGDSSKVSRFDVREVRSL
jgi:hypothetical protein